MSRRVGMTAVYANITPADGLRVRRFIGPQSINDWMRGLINADLEACGEVPLDEGVRSVRRRRPKPPPPIRHGTLGGYIHRKCRCDRCRQARRDYYSHVRGGTLYRQEVADGGTDSSRARVLARH